jgi:hypothetical protein
MITCLMPRVVTVLDASGHPWFGIARDGSTATDERDVIWLDEPHLIPGHHWAEPSQVRGGLALDVAAVTELLAHALDIDPDTLDDAAAVAIVARELDRVGCDMERVCLEVQADSDDHYDGGRRWARCVMRAARLLEVAV